MAILPGKLKIRMRLHASGWVDFRCRYFLIYKSHLKLKSVSCISTEPSGKPMFSNRWFNKKEWKQKTLYMKLALVAQMVKNLPAMWETWVWPLGQEDPLEKRMTTHSNILAWRIPWAEEPGRLQSLGLQSLTQLKWLSMHTSEMQTQQITSVFPIDIFYFFCSWQ